MSRGIDEEKAIELSIIGFIEAFREELPLEYAVELSNLLKNNFQKMCKIKKVDGNSRFYSFTR